VDVNAHREEFLDLCAAHALGSIEPGDRTRLEAHLREGCARCEETLAEFGRSVTLLAASAAPATPGPSLRARVLETVRVEAAARQATPWRRRAARPRIAWFPAVGWAAAAALAVLAGFFWQTNSRLRATLAQGDESLVSLSRQLEAERQWAAVWNAPGARTAMLQLTAQGRAELRGRAVYDPATRRAVLVLENATPPEGRDYQLWAIRSGAPANLGLVHAGASGVAVFRLEDAGDPAALSAFAVSLEPKGGSPDPAAPSGPVVLFGELGG
jgi:anti-sigma-K factor RskA